MKYPALGSRHLDVLCYLWSQEEAAPRDIKDYFFDALGVQIHPNTISTMLARMMDQKLVARNGTNPFATYTALVTREEVLKYHLGQLTDSYFGGDKQELTDYLTIEK